MSRRSPGQPPPPTDAAASRPQLPAGRRWQPSGPLVPVVPPAAADHGSPVSAADWAPTHGVSWRRRHRRAASAYEIATFGRHLGLDPAADAGLLWVQTPPFPCVSTCFAAKTLPFPCVFRCLRGPRRRLSVRFSGGGGGALRPAARGLGGGRPAGWLGQPSARVLSF